MFNQLLFYCCYILMKYEQNRYNMNNKNIYYEMMAFFNSCTKNKISRSYSPLPQEKKISSGNICKFIYIFYTNFDCTFLIYISETNLLQKHNILYK